jgi:Ring finger domain
MFCATVDGDIVVSGTSCSHLFHESCVFEWLAKKDHCPYCREAMATPSEMRTAAEEILGQERVSELWGIRNTIGLGHV